MAGKAKGRRHCPSFTASSIFPAAALADYLGLSAMGLQRLFRRSAGRAPGRAFLELKMREADLRLTCPGSTKETAFALGYRHPGDFTRAYARFHGHPPSAP